MLTRPPFAPSLPTRAALATAIGLATATGAPPARSAPSPAPILWTDATPDEMIDRAKARATAPDGAEHARMAALAVIDALADRAAAGHARAALEEVAGAAAAGAEVRTQASLLARTLAADEGSLDGARADHALGVVEDLSVLGPFRDNGGGLDAHDGPELGPAPFSPGERYSWGAYDVAWRPVPRAFATARGVPLDLFVSPRKESCTWLAAHLVVRKAQPLALSVAATGQVRLLFDGFDVARDDAVNEASRFDRVAARVEAGAGDHLVAAKVCSGALDDDGRLRLRVTDPGGAWPDGVDESVAPWAPRARGPRPKTRATSTPLGRSLEPSASGSIDERLDAAIVRTLGGADDLRSPRAPGLLAALTTKDLDDDRLAMAAWIAPSGANRSAWLHRARAARDPGTRAFVERRLVERHLDAQLSDWAMATLLGAHLDQATDPEAALLSAQVDLALGTDALRLRALRRLAATDDRGQRSTPNAVLELLANVAEGLAPKRALAARRKLAERGSAGGDLVRVTAATVGRGATVAAAHRALAGGVVDADDALEVARAVARTGAYEEARAINAQLASWAPNRAEVWAALSEQLGATSADRGIGGAASTTASAELLAALRRARELDPGQGRYRAELGLRDRSRSPEGEARDDEKYLVASSVILARRQGGASAAPLVERPSRSGEPSAKALPPPTTSKPAPAIPDVADRELHWLRAVVMHPDRRVSELVHYAREIVIPPRTEDELYEDLPAEGDLTEIVRARVHRKDGTEAFPIETADGEARPRIRWPELHAGDVVEVAFRSWSGGPVGGRGDPPFYRLDYAGSLSTHPVLYNEDIVESPADHPIYAEVIHGKADRREESDDGGRHVVRFVWENPTNVPDEPLAPPLSEIVPVLVMSTFADWGAFRAWYAEAVRGFTEPDAQVRELAAALTQGKTGREDKLRALFNFVADDIRYVNYVSGEWWLPNRPQELLARREGDCDDKALLLITLLKAAGIDAQEVMVQTRMTGEPSILRARGAAAPLFDHGIAFLPGPRGGTYLDATSPQSRLGPLPSMDARAPALRMDGPAQIVTLPSSSPDDHGLDATWSVTLSSDGSAALQGEERATGDDAFWMRTYLGQPAGRAQWVEDYLLGAWFPTVEVDKKVDFEGDLGLGAARVRWRGRSDGLARREGTELVVPLAPAQTAASRLAPLVRRTLPVWLPPSVAPRRESRTMRVRAPAGWDFETLPPGGDADGGPFGRAKLEVKRDPSDRRTVIVKRSVTFDQSEIATGEYPRWRAWVQQVDALMHKGLRLTRTGAGT